MPLVESSCLAHASGGRAINIAQRGTQSVFDNPLYDPGAAWRLEPATDGQYEKLADLGVATRKKLTKGEATDAIAQRVEADPEEREFLQFFGVTLSRDASQFEARTAISTIISNPANRSIWNARPATKEQKHVLASVLATVPRGLTYMEAEAKLQELGQDEGLDDRLYEAQREFETAEDAKFERAETVKTLVQEINDYVREDPHIFGIRKVSQKLVSQAGANIERERGLTLTDLYLKEDELAEMLVAEIKRLSPEHVLDAAALKKAQRKAAKRYGTQSQKSASGSGWVWLVMIAGFLLLLFAQ